MPFVRTKADAEFVVKQFPWATYVYQRMFKMYSVIPNLSPEECET